MRCLPALCVLSALAALSTNAAAQCELDRLVPSTGVGWRSFLAIEDDLAVIGGGGPGAAVFERGPGGWSQVDTFQTPGFLMFQYIALDASSDTAVTGSQEGNGDMSGSAFVFERSQGWALTQTLVPSNAEGYDAFGAGVAIEGDTIVVGATMSVYDVGACGPGKGYVFERTETSGWVETASFAPHGFQNTMIMYGVAVDTDGQTAVIGANDDDEFLSSAGAAYIYERDATGWYEAAKLFPPAPAPMGEFGCAVSVDGSVMLIGDDNDGGMGVVHAYERDAAGWQLVQSFAPADLQAGDRFGDAIAMTDSRAVIGASGADGVSANAGAVYVFTREAGGWVQLNKIVPDDVPESAALGSAVALDNNTLLSAGSWNSEDIRVHSIGADSENYCLSVVNSSGAPAVISTEGCGSVQGNSLTMRIDSAPASQPGVFFFAPDPAQVTFFDGFLCLAPPFNRLPPALSSPTGVLRTTLDFGSWPAYLITAGSTWRFQAFLRDPGFGTGVNTSDGIEIMLLP
jgi:hypothetical protein